MAQGKYQQKKWDTNRILLRAVIVVLSLLLVLLIVTAVALTYVLGRISRYDRLSTEPTGETIDIYETDPTQEGEETGETVDPNSVVWDDVDTMNGEHIINIMLIGQDARPGESRARSDTMIMVSLNKKANTIQLTSFMRDMYVQIPGYYDNRMNVAFAVGGAELLDETLEKNFGVVIDGNVEVNFETFSDVIDVLGGVDVELDSEEASYLRGCGYDVSAGVNHLNGTVALTYARMRNLSGSDYSRTERQRRLIASVIESLKDSSVKELLLLVNEVLPLVKTDLSDSQIISYATTGLAALSDGGEIRSVRIPADDAHYNANINGMAVLVPDLEMCQEDLKEFIYNEE